MALSNALLFLSFFFAFPYLQHAFFHTTIFSRFGESSDVCFACFCATMALLLIVAGAFGKKVVSMDGVRFMDLGNHYTVSDSTATANPIVKKGIARTVSTAQTG